MSNEDNQLQDKQKAYFNAGLNAWLQTRMERDKQLLTLSSAFFGVLMIFYRDERLDNTVSFVLWCASSFLFIATIVMILKTFSVNADYLEQLLNRFDTQKDPYFPRSLVGKDIILPLKRNINQLLIGSYFDVLFSNIPIQLHSFKNHKTGDSK